MIKRAALLLILALPGCIPPGAPNGDWSEQGAMSPDQPRIDPELDTLFDEKPIWEARPVVANARTVQATTYTVQPGDTLRGIGERTGAGSEILARENGLIAPYIIKPGQVLTVPAGRFHKVSAGETGIAIARAYAVGWGTIIDLNKLSEPFSLRIGQRLMLPPGAEPTATAVDARAKAFKLDIEDILTGGEPAVDSGMAVAVPNSQPTRPLAPTVTVSEPSSFTGGFIWPANGSIASRFGAAGEGQVNDGIDIAVEKLSQIRASGDGVVAFVGTNVANYGGLILIRHGNGWITAYGRATQASVTRGQKVSRGQVIGKMGTGAAPLLYFQMRKNRLPVDPLKQLPAPNG
jgi:murein DD-endopeptidase MepM/ murein hydrolase activator NlpD